MPMPMRSSEAKQSTACWGEMPMGVVYGVTGVFRRRRRTRARMVRARMQLTMPCDHTQ